MFSGISPTMYPLNLMKFHPETFAGFRPLMPGAMPGALPGMLPPRPEHPGPLGLVPGPPVLTPQPPHTPTLDDKASVKSAKSSSGDLNDAEMDSSEAGSDIGEINEIDAEKLDASHREILEKLKRQEAEEKVEIERELKEAQIERELKEAQRSALERVRRHEEIRAQELRAAELRERAQELKEQEERERDRDINSEHEDHPEGEIRTQRPLGLLAQHNLTTTKSHHSSHHGHHQNMDREKDRERERERENRERSAASPPLSPRPSPRPSPADYFAHHPLAIHPAFTDRFSRSPPTPSNSSEVLGGSPAHHWTFEEQFKQLYELSDDPKRKEFLDELFTFMQKRGTPVNRIPIMAKQTLDLFELFRLVVSKGGLVEVINKKLWREITKGLNLPSSITSAAFTLRTQYMKYLYPYECEKLKLSSPAELQAAIDGNRREGRRPSYGYDFPTMPTFVSPAQHLNGSLLNGRPSTGSSGSGDEETSLPTTPNHLRSLAERDARAMEAASRAMEEATKRMEEASRQALREQHTPILKTEEPPMKRQANDEDRLLAHMGMPSAHFKITSRNDGRSEFDSSLVVSMEINGIMYQGVLFAQHHRRI